MHAFKPDSVTNGYMKGKGYMASYYSQHNPYGNLWSVLEILIIGENKVVRFSEMAKMIPDISSRVLSETLKTLEADGLLDRKVYPVVPPKVEYRLTEMGESLLPLIEQMTAWAKANMKAIQEHRRLAAQSRES